MRNLKLLHSLHIDDATELKNTQCFCIDFDTGHIYSATPQGIHVLDPSNQQILNQVSLVENGYLPPDGSGKIVGIQYLPDQTSACVATAQGDVILWNTLTQELECVGSVDSGLEAMGWSPDQELVVLCTGHATIIVMTREFNPVIETPLQPSEFGEAKFVNVGWGKKETQFHGSEGKQAAAKKAEPVRAAFSWDDGKPRVSWRGDGQYFAVSSISPETGARKMRVWSRECELFSTSEDVDGIEQPLAWKPSGSLVATTQRKPNKHDIAFFEKNGLRHGDFTLPFGVNQVKVLDILWNNDSSVLAVWCEDMPPGDSTADFHPNSYVLLWTSGNYHWYLKQTLKFSAVPEERVAAVNWDPEHAYRIHIICEGGRYLQYTWSWSTDHSHGLTSEDMANVGVIDGTKVLMTPFRKMVVPPPMCAYSLQLPDFVNQIAFCSGDKCNDIAVVLGNGKVVIYSDDKQGETSAGESVKIEAAGGNGFKVMCSQPSMKGIYSISGADLSDTPEPLSVSHFTFISKQSFLFCVLNIMGCESVLCEAELNEDKNEIQVKKTTDIPGRVLNVCQNSATSSVAIQLIDGAVHRYEKGILTSWKTPEGRDLKFNLPCTEICLAKFKDEEVVLGLTERYRFYVNDVEIASNCTSFEVHNEFLLLTTHSHTCRCISLNTSLNVLPTLSDGKAHPFDESIRRVERGSRIVHVVPEDTKLVLQMPRGNLEVIHPRALVLSAVRKCLDRLKYGEAFTIMRKHRINMNLMYDHNPQVFFKNVGTFIKEIESVNHINLFLTDLQEEDVTVTMYTAAYNREVSLADEESTVSKIDTICDVMKQEMEKMNPDKYLLSIITAYVRKTKPELDVALQRIKKLKDEKTQGQLISPEEALKYLLFLVDVNELYDVALGTYDFELVLMVAEKSQKDPKEYLPFLNSLRKLEEHYQKYTIDKHLKRYRSALIHISKCSDHFEECLQLVKEHRLYTAALEIYKIQTQEYKDVSSAYAEYLTERKRFEEAGLVLAKAGECEAALEAYEKSLNWRQCLCMAAILNLPNDGVATLSRRLAGKLKDNRRHVEASCLLEQYANDPEEAIVTLLEGHAWEEALRVMHKYKRTDFIESDMKSSLLECCETQHSTLDANRSDFEKYKKRLVTVREQKERARLEFLEGGGHFNDADADLFSDTSSATGESVRSSKSSSGTTVYSRTSSRSAKNKRKAERRKWSLKEGSPHEDLALVEALSKIIKQTEEMKDDIGSLLKMLVLFHNDKQAAELQNKFGQFLSLIEKSISVIWNPEQEQNSSNTFTLGPDATVNSIVQGMQNKPAQPEVQLDAHLRVPPTLNKEFHWKVHLVDASGDH